MELAETSKRRKVVLLKVKARMVENDSFPSP